MTEAGSGSAPAALSPLDSSRFGVRVARAPQVTLETLPDVLDFCKQEGVQLLMARCETKDLSLAQTLERHGFFLTDTLVYFRRDLNRPLLPEPRPVTIRPALEADAPAVGEIARQAFRGYDSHYHADPRLDRAACDALYVDWAERSCRQADMADCVLLAEVSGQTAGFLTLKRISESEADGRLYAVLPSMQGQGIGQALLIAGLHWCKERGLQGMVISTQITNLASQISWIRVGFVPHSSFYTFHKWFDK
ncbi:MAG: GNAT family N-acetyltransferase [Anaerolineales bacterium]|nr:GNAT family N-acetyltransferase [Anaerolineales bacterium]MDW8226303.1 GNAT family N-acetyltransferase [Anaerolineales bacterium]